MQTNMPGRTTYGEPPTADDGQSGAPNKVGRVTGSAVDAGQDVASEATDRARQTASLAVEQVQDVAATAAGHAQDLVGSVKQEAGRVTEEVSSQARSLADETKSQLETQAQEAAVRLAKGFSQLAGEAQALAEGRPADAANLTEYVWQAADRLYSTADGLNGLVATIDQRGIEGLVSDAQAFARRRPAAFLLGATVAGFGIGRMIRSRSADPPPPAAGHSNQPPVGTGAVAPQPGRLAAGGR